VIYIVLLICAATYVYTNYQIYLKKIYTTNQKLLRKFLFCTLLNVGQKWQFEIISKVL